MKKTPIAIFTYNRSDHTQKLLHSLAQCARLDECDVVIFCDGLKKEEHRADVEATRQLVREWADQHTAQVVVREQNLNLKKSIETGVTDLCSRYGRVIVLEDDLVLHAHYIAFMLSALDHYEQDERVMQVTGFTFLFAPGEKQGVRLMPASNPLGWGTWQRAWQSYRADPTQAFEVLKDPEKAFSFNLDGAYPYLEMITGVVEGRVQSWAVLFWYAIWQRKGLVVYPRQSLVQNEGFDGRGVNSGLANDTLYIMRPVDENPTLTWDFPSQPDMRGFQQLRRFYKAHFMPSSYRYRIRRFFGRLRLFLGLRLRRFLPLKA